MLHALIPRILQIHSQEYGKTYQTLIIWSSKGFRSPFKGAVLGIKGFFGVLLSLLEVCVLYPLEQLIRLGAWLAHESDDYEEGGIEPTDQSSGKSHPPAYAASGTVLDPGIMDLYV